MAGQGAWAAGFVLREEKERKKDEGKRRKKGWLYKGGNLLL